VRVSPTSDYRDPGASGSSAAHGHPPTPRVDEGDQRQDQGDAAEPEVRDVAFVVRADHRVEEEGRQDGERDGQSRLPHLPISPCQP